MPSKKTEPIVPITTRITEPQVGSGITKKYGKRGVRVIQEPYSKGSLESLALASLVRIRDKHIPHSWEENGRVAVSDDGDLLVGLIVKSGSGQSQVLVKIESEEIFAHLAEMRDKAASTDS